MTTSSSDLVPKAELSAYQRWELASLTAPLDVLPGNERTPGGKEPDPRESAAKALQAQKDGYAAGYSAGIGEAEEARLLLASLLASIGESAEAHRQQLLDEILDFSLLLARQMVGEALAVRRELVLQAVGTAMKELPQMSQRVQVLLAPGDVELVRSFLAADATPVACTLLADSTIAPGGCRIVTEQCEVDATVQTRWRRLLANLGCSDEWFAPN